MAAAKVHQLTRMRDDTAMRWSAADGHAPPTLEVEQAFVAQGPERAQHRIPVHTQLGREIARRRQPFTRGGFAVCNGPSYLGSYLLVQLGRRVAVQLDPKHGASNTSFIGPPVETPPRTKPVPPSEGAAEALFEEARQRARRRRRQSAAVVGVLLLLAGGAAVLLDSGPGERPTGATNDRKGRVTPLPDAKLFVQLLEYGEPIAVVDVATSKFRLRDDLRTAGGDPPYRLYRTGNRLVYFGPGGTYAIDLDVDGAPQKLGKAWYFIPSATEGRVWLTFLDEDSPETVRDLESVVETTVRGRVTVRSKARPPCRGPTILAAAEGALLCQYGRALRVFDPASGEVLLELPGSFVADTHRRLVAWWANRRPGHSPALHITNIGTGRDRVVSPGDSFRFTATYDGAFSPDGSRLAVPVRARRTAGEPRTRGRWQVALVDVVRGAAQAIDGSRLPASYHKLAWSSSGDLFFTAGEGRLMAYRPGSHRPRLLPVRLDAPILGLAAD